MYLSFISTPEYPFVWGLLFTSSKRAVKFCSFYIHVYPVLLKNGVYPTRHFFNAGLSAAFHLGFRSPAFFCFVPVSFVVHSASVQIHAYCPYLCLLSARHCYFNQDPGRHACILDFRAGDLLSSLCNLQPYSAPANFSFHHFARFFTCSSILKIPACFRMDLLRKCALPLVVYRLLSTSFDSG